MVENHSWGMPIVCRNCLGRETNFSVFGSNLFQPLGVYAQRDCKGPCTTFVYEIIVDGGAVAFFVQENFERITIKPVEACGCAEPEKALLIFDNGGDSIVG